MGRKHAIVFKGLCPYHLQIPFGKEINVSFYPSFPFSIPSLASGSDFLTLKLLAKKFGFIPRFKVEKFADAIGNDGMIYSVS